MRKSYKNLQAEVEELESVLDEALLVGPEGESESHETVSNDIKQKLALIGNLLSAEVASHPSKPHHLHHMSERFTTLEREFHHWDSFRILPFHDLDKDSTCSCTHSCLNDEENNGFDKDAGGGKEILEFDGPERETRVGNKSCAVAAGLVIGIFFMAFIMVNVSDCFRFVEQVSFAAPT